MMKPIYYHSVLNQACIAKRALKSSMIIINHCHKCLLVTTVFIEVCTAKHSKKSCVKALCCVCLFTNVLENLAGSIFNAKLLNSPAIICDLGKESVGNLFALISGCKL